MPELFEKIGFWAGIMLPLFDIPLIMHVVKRKSSADISMVWAVGLWSTSVMLLIGSKDPLASGFNIVNVLMLSIVVLVVIKYRKAK